MSKLTFFGFVVIILVLAGIGIWWWSAGQNSALPSTAQTGSQTNGGANTAPAIADNSDQTINQEMTNIDTQINGFSSDSASINQGLNDQPVQQSQF